ncbi:unnamed protein product [Urochloa decumbens]|uniref:DUF7595 domain-containing protein n=1 Tax=Urochloa decumbens TaxID=240449 RepID=A0ABC9G2Z7_9POAL
MAGDSGGDAPRPPGQASRGRCRRHQAASLPIDLMADIAARSDPVTLLRCAATCSDMRCRVADPAFRRRLRLRHANRFVPSLLRGHLIGDKSKADKDEHMCLVDAPTAGATIGLLASAAESFPHSPDGEPLKLHRPVSARDGLVLVYKDHELRVCNLATGCSQPVPHGDMFGSYYALLVGDGKGGAAGRPFQVVTASLVLEQNCNHLLVQAFSSELGTWGPCTEIRTPQIHGQAEHAYGYPPRSDNALRARPLVVGGAVHWLCLTDKAGYVLKLCVGAAAAAPRLTVTKLPGSYPYNSKRKTQHLLATMEAGGSPAVLVADGDKISAWIQSKHTARWNQKPQVVIKYEEISRFIGDPDEESRLAQVWVWRTQEHKVSLVWFAERSGIVLIRMYDDYLFWLDLQSMKILRCSSDPRICRNKFMYRPCEMDLTTWVPTFSSSLACNSSVCIQFG